MFLKKNGTHTHIFIHNSEKIKNKNNTTLPPSSYISRDTGGEQMVKKKVKLEITFSKKKAGRKTHFSMTPLSKFIHFVFYF